MRLLVNTMTAEEKYSLLNSEKLPQPSQMQLYKKQKVFPQCVFAFLKPKPNFKHFLKIDESHSFCIFEIIDCKRRGYLKV